MVFKILSFPVYETLVKNVQFITKQVQISLLLTRTFID